MSDKRQRNSNLASLLDETRLSHAGLARRVNEAIAQMGLHRRYDKTSVSHWLAGRVPRDPVPQVVADVFTRLLGRVIGLRAAGFAVTESFDPGRALVYPATIGETIEVITDLARADMERRGFLKGALVSVTALGLASRDWLVSSPDGRVSRTGTLDVGASDVEWLRTLTQHYRNRDLQVGGGDLRRDVVSVIHRQVGPMLRGTYSDAVGRELLTAAADTCALAGWMAYDQAYRGLAMRYYIQGLRLARAAGDPEIAAHILTRMSYLALDEDLPHEAVAQARAAVHAAAATTNPRVKAYTDVVEARAQAVAGGRREARAALGRAESRYDPTITDAPGWALVHDPAELANQFAHVHLDLKDTAPGLRSISVAIAGKTDATRRSLAKCHIRAARLSILAGEIEVALDHIGDVSRTLPMLSSVRVHKQLAPVRQELVAATGSTSRYVRAFDERTAH